LHQNTITLQLRLNSIELALNWYEAIKYTIENMSGYCAKCCSKPKLVVNPMPLLSSPNTLIVDEPQQQAPTTSLVINKDEYDKLVKENTQLNSKYKLLEQIHLEAIAEYDNQHELMFNQIDELNLKLNKTDLEQGKLQNLLAQSKQQADLNLNQIKTLNEQLVRCKDTIERKDREIEELLVNKEREVEEIAMKDCTAVHNLTRANWNKEVKNLDARITDVLGKFKSFFNYYY